MKIVITPRSSEKQQVKPKSARPPEEEELEDEMEWPAFQPINLKQNVFDSSSLRQREGINTAPSTFEKHCVFHTVKSHD